MAEQLATTVLHGHLGALRQLPSLETHVTAQGLHHADPDRLAWRDLHTADGIGTFKGCGRGPTACHQKYNA